MKIVNPIYDNAFKYLMDNVEIAKRVLSIILDTQVISLQPRPQETPFIVGNIHLSRYDYKAIMRAENGEKTTVLVEVQKYKTPDPILRFRQYLAQNYMREETITNQKGNEEKKTLPIISIYILGFDLPEFDCKAIRIDNTPYDVIGQKVLNVKSNFVEQLTHKSFILLAVEKPEVEKCNTRLERFLDLFLQKLKGDPENPVIEITANSDSDEYLQSIISHLNSATLNEELLRSINAEKEHYKSIDNLEEKIQEERRQKEEAKAREEDERRQKEEAKAREEEAKAREESERRQKEDALKQSEKILKISVKKLSEKGLSDKEIGESLGIPVEKVRSILQNK